MADNFYGITDTGRIRENNEDTFIAEKVWSDAFIAACVIDGVGGYEGGEVAAQLARDTILEQLRRPAGDAIQAMMGALTIANERIYTERTSNVQRDSMACVLTMAMVDTKNNQFYYTHIGDTRLYLFRDDSLVKLTKDHSFVGFLEDSGRLTEDAAMSHPKRNEINKALGFDPQMSLKSDYIETGSSPFLPGDLLLLCSDGLTDLVNSQSITAILSSDTALEEKGKALISAANSAGGKDNITVVLVENTKKRTRQKATRPTLIKKNEEQPRNEEVPKVQEPAPPIRSVRKKSDNRTLIIALSVLSALLLLALLWALFRKPAAEDELITPMQGNRYPKEQNLVDAINGATATRVALSDTSVGFIVPISDTIYIDQDSLHLVGNGIVLQGDSSFTGPAFAISPACKYLLLENLVFQDFRTAIIAGKDVLHLKNVRFRNCTVPVQYQFSFTDNRYISGRIKDSLLFRSDSLPR